MKNLSLKYGLLLFVCLSMFFYLMSGLGLAENYNLRLFNGVIHLIFLILAIHEFRENHPELRINYVRSVGIGMSTSFIGVVGFAIFQIIYLHINKRFLENLQESVPIGEYLTPWTAGLVVIVEGVAFSLVVSYVIIRVMEMLPKKS